MKNLTRFLRIALGFAIAAVYFHFNLAGCEVTHTQGENDRVRKSASVSVGELTNNTDLYHDSDVIVSGEVTSVGGFVYNALWVKQYTLRTPNGHEIVVIAPDREAVPNVGRQLTVYGRFKQCTYYARAGLPCALWEFHREVVGPEPSAITEAVTLR